MSKEYISGIWRVLDTFGRRHVFILSSYDNWLITHTVYKDHLLVGSLDIIVAAGSTEEEATKALELYISHLFPESDQEKTQWALFNLNKTTTPPAVVIKQQFEIHSGDESKIEKTLQLIESLPMVATGAT